MESLRLSKMLLIGSTVWRMGCGYAHVLADIRSCGKRATGAFVDCSSTFSVILLSVACWTEWSTLSIKHPSIMLTIHTHHTVVNQICQTTAIVHQSSCHDSYDMLMYLLCFFSCIDFLCVVVGFNTTLQYLNSFSEWMTLTFAKT